MKSEIRMATNRGRRGLRVRGRSSVAIRRVCGERRGRVRIALELRMWLVAGGERGGGALGERVLICWGWRMVKNRKGTCEIASPTDLDGGLLRLVVGGQGRCHAAAACAANEQRP